MRSALIAGLDVGSSRTRAVIGEYVRERRCPTLRVRGVGETPTEGVRRGRVNDIDAAADCIGSALVEAETMASARVDRVYVGVGGEHVRVERSIGVVAVEDDAIVDGDVNRVNAVAQAVPLHPDAVVLHAIPQEYSVDRRGGVLDPVGMTGVRLEAELCLVTASATDVGNLTRAVAKAGYRVQDVMLAPLAAARAVVAEDEKELGVAVIDMGSELTGLSLFSRGKIRELAVVSQGGTRITSDLIRALAIPFASATEIKERCGSAHARSVDPAEVVKLPGLNGRVRTVARRHVAEIVEHRLSDMLEQVRRELGAERNLDGLGAGLVLTGGAARTRDIAVLARQCLGVPARIGAPHFDLHPESGLGQQPEFATAVGLALHGTDCYADTGGARPGWGSGVVSRIGAWLKSSSNMEHSRRKSANARPARGRNQRGREPRKEMKR